MSWSNLFQAVIVRLERLSASWYWAGGKEHSPSLLDVLDPVVDAGSLFPRLFWRVFNQLSLVD